jgi:hypothetical protein
MVAVSATSATAAASVTISLSPDAISIVPAEVCLHAGQKQQFQAIVASGSGDAEPITWILTPDVEGLDQKGLYTVRGPIPDDGTLTVTAVSKRLGKQASAKVTLKPEPWRGAGPILLAAYLFLVFCVVYLMILLWPSEVRNVDVLKANQAQAQANHDKSELALKTELGSKPQPPQPDAKTKTNAAGATATTNNDRQQASDALLTHLQADVQRTQTELDAATTELSKATAITVDTRMVKKFNREIDFLCLVLLAGAFGSFLHMAQSFSAFAGNRTLKSSWVWWYCFLPFVGGGLAVVLYAGLRGGLVTLGASAAVKATDLNAYGLVAAAALAGMFSKAATTKLGEVFETLFQTSKGGQNKDPLKTGPQGGGQPAGPSTPSAPGGGSSTAGTEQTTGQQK